MSDYIPADPKNIVLSPISAGMVRNLPSNRLPNGSVWTAQNFLVGESGPKRSPGYIYYGGTGTGNSLPLRALITFWNTSGNQILISMDDKYLYTVSTSAFTAVNSTYTTGKVTGTISTNTLTGTLGTDWASNTADVKAGDLIVVSGTTYTITTVVSGTELTVTPVLAAGYAAVDYTIYRRFIATDPYVTDWTIIDNKAVFTSQGRMPMSYDGGTFGTYDSVDCTFQATCCVYFKDRLWFGDVQVGATRFRQRIIWSTTTDHTSFAATAYLDLPYMSGAVKRLLPLGDSLIAYFDDAIWIGRPTNLTNLPYAFKQVDTGGIGLPGMRAVCEFVGGHFFIGQDNIYMLSNRGLEMIGTPIVSETIRQSGGLQYAYVCPDPQNDRIVFGFPQSSSYISEVWSWNYKSKAWSYETISCSMLALTGLTPALVWNDMSSAGEAALPADNWDTGMAKYPGWDTIGTAVVSGTFHIGTTDGKLWRMSEDSTTTADGQAITAVLETGDFDIQQPNDEKTWLRVSLKIDTFLTTDLMFKVQVSGNRGRTWKPADLGSAYEMVIEAGEDEGSVDFKVSSSTFRVRFTSSAQVAQYTVTEVVIDYFSSASQERHLEPLAAS